jgi:hypothetical protein
MNRIAKQTAFYRGYLADNRSLVPLTVLLAAAVPIWLLVYLIGTPADARQDSGPAYSSGRGLAGPGRCASSAFSHSALR